VSNTPGTHNDNSLLSPTDILYVDWAVINNGTGAATARFNTEIYVDGVRRTGWFYDPPLDSNHWSGVQDYVIGSFAPGTHTVRIKADYTNAVPESNESDNEYTKTFTVASGASCTALPTNLCLNAGGRLRVTVAWRVPSQGTGGQATAVALSADSGYFWFFNNSNVELVVKTVDGRSVNGRFWVFYGALSNVEYTVTVTDTLTGAVKTYSNPNGTLASVADTEAF
jgi:hypothetical protein